MRLGANRWEGGGRGRNGGRDNNGAVTFDPVSSEPHTDGLEGPLGREPRGGRATRKWGSHTGFRGQWGCSETPGFEERSGGGE